MECLKNIIGLSKTTCECLTDQLPTGSDEISDYNVSASGVYMDKLPGFNVNVATGSADCADGGIWKIMYDAREEATQDYKTNLLAVIGSKYKQRINNFSGKLGQETFQGTLALTTAYAGQKITPVQVKGGFIILKSIGVIINSNANVTVKVYNNKNGSTLLYSSTIVGAIANETTWGDLTTPLELPMWDDSGLTIKYYVVMQLNGTFQPKANKKNCGCNAQEKEPYKKWLSIEGANGNDISNPASFKITNELNGIVLDVDVKCKASEIICSSQYPLDFDNDANALSKAYAIRFRADAIVYQRLLSSDNINRFTMMNRDEIFKLIGEWNDKFMEWVNYEGNNADNLYENDCFVCREMKNEILKRSIIVTR